MGDYTAPPAPATCESAASTASATASADVPIAYDRSVNAAVCLDVDLSGASDKLINLDADASLE